MNLTTDPQNELLTQVDEQNVVVGAIERGVAHSRGGVIYRTIYVVVKNYEGEVLIQKRSGTKDLYPDCWDLSVGGHVAYGKTYEEVAIKELREELGIVVSKEKLRLVGDVLVELPASKEWFRVYEYTLGNDGQLEIEKEEIETVRWMRMDEIRKSMKEETLSWYERPVQVMRVLY